MRCGAEIAALPPEERRRAVLLFGLGSVPGQPRGHARRSTGPMRADYLNVAQK